MKFVMLLLKQENLSIKCKCAEKTTCSVAWDLLFLKIKQWVFLLCLNVDTFEKGMASLFVEHNSYTRQFKVQLLISHFYIIYFIWKNYFYFSVFITFVRKLWKFSPKSLQLGIFFFYTGHGSRMTWITSFVLQAFPPSFNSITIRTICVTRS